MALTRDDESVQAFPVPTQLLQADQLGREKRAGRCFQGFDEAPITFAPTYKCESTRGGQALAGTRLTPPSVAAGRRPLDLRLRHVREARHPRLDRPGALPIGVTQRGAAELPAGADPHRL